MADKKPNMKKGEQKESLMLVRPAVRSLGLDYLHVMLIILVVILVCVAFALSTYKQAPIVTVTNNSTTTTTQHTSSEALAAAQRVLAGYAYVNSSLSLLAFYAEPNRASVSYLSNSSKWLVVMPYKDPLENNATYNVSILLYGSNLTLVQPFLQTAKPEQTQNQEVAFGTISISGKVPCNTVAPYPAYAFFDPYAPGAVSGLLTTINATSKLQQFNTSYKFIFTGYAISKYSGFGVNQTQAAGQYLFCASRQSGRFPGFVKNYSILFTGSPLNNVTLSSIAIGSGMNMTQFNTCLQGASTVLNSQALLSNFYGITTTPAIVLNCKYMTIPQTISSAANYTLANP